ncbi:MAG: hypothetical protein MUQ32_07535 [Chloroflexi bacterium]|nr:hypothetical protein [Chloroflexota bacterium]
MIIAIAAMSFAGAQFLHEAGHDLVSVLFGRGPTWGTSSLVQLSDREPLRPEEWVRYVTTDGDGSWLRLTSLPTTDAEWILFFVAALLFQLLAIVVGRVIARRAVGARVRALGLLLALVNALGMCAYYALGALRGIGGDEANLGDYLGVPATLVAATFAIAALVGLGLVLQALAGRRERVRIGLLSLGIILVEGPLIMLANNAVRDQVDAGNPFFLPVLGFSFPVLVGAALAIGIAWWATGEPAARTREISHA